jgi:hypothetical protein
VPDTRSGTTRAPPSRNIFDGDLNEYTVTLSGIAGRVDQSGLAYAGSSKKTNTPTP